MMMKVTRNGLLLFFVVLMIDISSILVNGGCFEIGWKQITPNDKLSSISAASDGTVYGIKKEDNPWMVHQLSPDESIWNPDILNDWDRISVGSANNVYAIRTGHVWAIKPTFDSAEIFGVSEVSVGRDGTVWALKDDHDDEIWRKTQGSTSIDYKWEQVPGDLVQIDVEDKNHILGINRINDMYARNTKTNDWIQVTPGSDISFIKVSMAADGSVVALNGYKTNNIWKLNYAVEEANNGWQRICHSSMKAESIAVVNYTLIYMVDEHGDVYKSTITLKPRIPESYSFSWYTYTVNDHSRLILGGYDSWGYGSYYFAPPCPYSKVYLYGYCQTGCDDGIQLQCGWGYTTKSGEYCAPNDANDERVNYLCFNSNPIDWSSSNPMGNGDQWKDIVIHNDDNLKPFNFDDNGYDNNIIK